jgi:D-methionine transport system ATP-binding protein
MIEIVGLQKIFGDLEVLQNINLTIRAGEIYGLIGRSGAGKSTLLRCINGLESYNRGSLKVDNVEINSLSKKKMRHFRRGIGMIFQQFSLLEKKTVYENIALPLRCWKYDREVLDKRIYELAELVGISDKLKSKPRTLSGGQKQRVAIARALTMEPKILLSDESTSALDPITTKSILALLREINENLGVTIIMVTHHMAVVRDICESVSLLQKGRLTVSGKVEDIFLHRPPEFVKFLGEDRELPLTSNVNLEILVSGDEVARPLFSTMARELDVDFSIIGGKMEKYRDKVLGSWISNFSKKDVPRVTKYLDDHNIAWHKLLKKEADTAAEE